MLDCLSHPLDPNYIIRKKRAIKKELLINEYYQEINVAILGGSTTSEIKDILELFLLDLGVKAKFYESSYNKFYEEAVFDNEALESFNPDIIYLHTSNVNIVRYPNIDDNEEVVDALLSSEIGRFVSIWASLDKYSCAVIQNNFELPVVRNLGNLDFYHVSGKVNYINRLNLEFSKMAREINYLYISDINYLSSKQGMDKWFDRRLWYLAKYTVSFESIPLLAKNLSSIISAILGYTKKCLVLDLDNTCWGGVVGEDGVAGLDIGSETASSQAYMDFQKNIIELKNRGVSLAVCSKNNYEDALQGLEHPSNILKLKDFVSFKANWDRKDKNILEISNELNLNVDSFVFVDDNPSERDIVSSQVSGISVPDVGDDVIDYIDHINDNGYFEIISLLDDDLKRNQYYSDNIKRVVEKNKYENYGEFLGSLDMRAEIDNFSEVYLDRITQLINKTNQFNLTTKRYTLAEISNIYHDSSYIKIYGKMSDKYGDNGLVSVLIGSIDDRSCHIDIWLLSCRVLKRDMEHAMFDKFVKFCKSQGVTKILGYYVETKKNSIVSCLYDDLGFEKLTTEKSVTIWSLNIDNYKNKNKLIKVMHE